MAFKSILRPFSYGKFRKLRMFGHLYNRFFQKRVVSIFGVKTLMINDLRD